MSLEETLQPRIERAFADRKLLGDPDHRYAVEGTLAALDRGELRVASPPAEEGGEWTTHAWVKQAILLYFAVRKMETIERRPVRVPRQDPAQEGARRRGRARRAARASCATARSSSRACIVMPGLREHRRARRRGHDGRHVGHGRLVRADRARLPPLGRRRHRRRARAARARSRSSSRTACFVGSRAVIVEGVLVGREAVIGAGVVLTSSTADPRRERRRRSSSTAGVVPPRSVVIPGMRTKKFPAGEYRRPVRAHHRPAHREHRPEGQPERGAPRLRRPGVSRGRDCKRRASSPREALDETLLWLCAIASPIGEERALCDAVPERLAVLRLPAPIRRYGDSIVVPVTRAHRRAARRARRAPRHRAHGERPRAHRGRPLLRRGRRAT